MLNKEKAEHRLVKAENSFVKVEHSSVKAEQRIEKGQTKSLSINWKYYNRRGNSTILNTKKMRKDQSKELDYHLQRTK